MGGSTSLNLNNVTDQRILRLFKNLHVGKRAKMVQMVKLKIRFL